MNYRDEKDEQIVERIINDNSSEGILELRKRHKGLISAIIKKYAGAVKCSGLSFSDLESNADFLIFSAAKDFDASKAVKFSTWLANKVRYYCLEEISDNKKYLSEDSNTSEFLMNNNADEVEEELSAKKEKIEYVNYLLDHIKDKRVRSIIKMRYLTGARKKTPFAKIAKKLKISTQGAVDLHDDFIRFVKSKIKNEEFLDVF